MSGTPIDTLHHVHHLVWECYTALVPLGDDAFEDSELTLPMAGTLDLIGHNEGATVSDLARLQPKTQQAISQLVTKLEKHGLVERRLGRGRGVGLHLTPDGRAAWVDGAQREARIEQQIREILGEDIYAECQDALEKMRASFKDRDHRPALKTGES